MVSFSSYIALFLATPFLAKANNCVNTDTDNATHVALSSPEMVLPFKPAPSKTPNRLNGDLRAVAPEVGNHSLESEHMPCSVDATSIDGCTAPKDSGAASGGLLPIKEIASVKIFNGHHRLLRRPHKLYVEFSHRGKVRGKSLPLDNLLESSWTNLPLLANEEGLNAPVKCEIRRRRFLLPDKVLFTVDVDLRTERNGNIWSDIFDRKGHKTGALMKLEMFISEWIDGPFDQGTRSFKNMDFYFKMLSHSFGSFAVTFFPGDVERLRKPTQAADPNLEEISLLGGLIEYPAKDELFKVHWTVRYAVGWANRLPFKDSNHPIENRALARNKLRTGVLGKYMVEPMEGRWVAPLSDDSMHRLFFSNNGMSFIKKFEEADENGNLYAADMSYLGTLKHRKNYENLGCKVFFDNEAHITMIEDHDGSIYHPDDELWEWAKQKARTNVFITNAMEHLIIYHLHWANIPGMALRKWLPPTHPWRVAMTTHFFRTHITCFQAKDFLVAEYGPLHRSLPFEYEGGYKDIYNKIIGDFRFIEYTDELEKAGLKDDEYHVGSTDALGIRKVMMDYVFNLIDEIYPNEKSLEEDKAMHDTYEYMRDKMKGIPAEYNMKNVKMVWGEILFRVTAGHTNKGNVAIYALEPFMINFRMNKSDKGKLFGNKETSSVVTVIGGLTSPDEYPKITSDWRHVLHEPSSSAYETFQSEMRPISDEIDARNSVRRFVNVDNHPDFVMLSVFS